MTDFHRTAIMPILRWILLLPAIHLTRWVALFAGIALHEAALHLCPPEKFISGVCTVGWFRYLDGLITMHGAVAAVLFLGVSVWLAPSQ